MLGLGATEVEGVDDLQHIAQGVTGAEAVADFGKDLADLVFQRIGVVAAFAERGEVGEQLAVDELAQVLAGAGIGVELAVGGFRRGPGSPAVRFIEQRGVVIAPEHGFVGPLVLHVVQVLEEQQPRSLLGIVQLGGQPFVVAHGAVDVVEGVFKHGEGFS